MAGVNVLVIQGNLTKDPELKQVGDKDVCKMRIAVNTGYGDRETTSYIDVEVWGKAATACDEHLRKGDGIIASGELAVREWEGDRGKGTSVECKNARVVFGAKKSGDRDGGRDRDDDRGERPRKSREEQREDRDWERSDRERSRKKEREGRARDRGDDDGGRDRKRDGGGMPF